MLNYGKNIKPKGRLGDTVGILNHNHAVPDYQDKWKKNIRSRKFNRFSHKYIETLGDEVFNRMGYSYEETLNNIQEAKVAKLMERNQ